MTQLRDVEAFIDGSQRVTDPRSLDNLVADVAKEMGFDFYALIHHVDLSELDASLSHMSSGQLVALTNYPEAWVETYVKRKIVSDDPILIASQRSAVGFRWSDMPRLIEMTPAHKAITAETRRADLSDGFTVPAHIPGEANGSCNFAVRTGCELPEANLHMAQLIGSFAFQAARAMVRKAQNVSAYVHAALTPRQLECIALVARGKSDWEIGRILGIGEETAKHHIKMAREHYDVSSRVQAAFRAVFDGQIALSEVVK